MLTTRSAAELLAALNTSRGPGSLLAALGFSRIAPLDQRERTALGVPRDARTAGVARRHGVLRALVTVMDDAQPLRQRLPKLSATLRSQIPDASWLLIALRSDGKEAAVATWRTHERNARHSVLLVEPDRVRDSDAETISAMAAAGQGDDSLVHLRWQEILGRHALSARFYRALEQSVLALGEAATGAAPGDARREIALITASRLLFLSFLQTKGWLDGDTDYLVRRFDAALSTNRTQHDVQRRFLEPLMFGTLNTIPKRRAAAARALGNLPFLNGGLFARTPVEQRYRSLRLRDDDLTSLFENVLTRYRFTAQEERAEWSESAIDPEMLGRAFESLMASRERRETGAFYTPHALVTRTTDAALDDYLQTLGLDEPVREALLHRREVTGDDAERARRALASVRVLDPACGSGAFLVHVLERLADARASLGDKRGIAALRREVVTHSIFGVDVNPMAAWLCELRLWLSTIIELEIDDPAKVPPLPNLDRNIRVGDALMSPAWSIIHREHAGLAKLRAKYARATATRKRLLARQLDKQERKAAIDALNARLGVVAHSRQELVVTARGRDLFGGRRGSLAAERAEREHLKRTARQLRDARRAIERGSGSALPFSFSSHFADAAVAGGFDIVIGNPPWVRLHRIPSDRREALKRDYRVYREAAWQQGVEASGAGAGFGAQVDLAALFAERALALAAPGGVIALLLPVKLWRSLAGGGARRLLLNDHTLRIVEDWSDAPHAFDAAVYPSLTVVRKQGGVQPLEPAVSLLVHRKRLAIAWRTTPSALPFNTSPGSPWLMLPKEPADAFARITRAGTPLSESRFGSPTLGVKCGCNEAFLVRHVSTHGDTSIVASTRGNVQVDTALLRPVLRGEGTTRWRIEPDAQRILWTHDPAGRPMSSVPLRTLRHLSHWKSTLAGRSDARAGVPWWSLFRTNGAANDRPRVVWADVSKAPRAAVLPPGSPLIPLNSCYVLRCADDTDAAALVTLINSPLMGAWLDALAEPARGGYKRYMAWVVAQLPLPDNWARARDILAPIGARAVAGERIEDTELLDATVAAFRVSRRAVLPLLDWSLG